MLVRTDGSIVPKKIHLQITSRCNLNCPKCFYKSDTPIPMVMSRQRCLNLIEEFKLQDVQSLAIGGGEPMLVPWLPEVIDRADPMFTAVTTNGTILRDDVIPNAVAISYDELHPTSGEQVEEAVRFYYKNGCQIRINHVVTSMEWIRKVDALARKLNTMILFIIEKPVSSFNQWTALNDLLVVNATDACIWKMLGHECTQGKISMHINVKGLAGVCSNIKSHIPYTGLVDTWARLGKLPIECPYGNGKKSE